MVRKGSKHRPRKRFGQHFLHDPGTIERIVRTIAPAAGQHIVEIGPGLGAITLPLLAAVGEMDAIEIDRDAIRELEHRAAGYGRLTIHEGDVLEFDFAQLAATGPPLRLVGNLPYNISTPLLFRLIDQRQHFLDMHFMLQKEVVARMAAGPGTGVYGRLTVMLAPWLDVTPLFDIGKGAFSPPPRVVSTFVRLRPYAQAPFALDDAQAYARVVAAAFSHRRKTLRNALKSLLTPGQIEAAGIDPGLRPEAIAPAGFASLARELRVSG